MVSEQVLVQLRAVAASAIATGGPDLIVLFGSVATRRARTDSDADLAVVGGDPWRSLELGSRLAAILQREPHVVDLATASESLRFEVARGGVLLFERTPETWMRFQASAALRYYDLQPLIARCAEGVRRHLLAGSRP